MNIFVIAIVIISALFHALRNLLTKQSLDKQVFLWWYEILAMMYFLPFLIYFLFREGFPDTFAYYWCAVSGFIHFIYWIFLTKAYDRGDISHVYPIIRSSPALVLLFAIIILDEKVSSQGFFGVLVVTFGVYIINLKKLNWQELLASIRSLSNHRSIQYAFLALCSVTAYSIVDKISVRYIHPVLFTFFHLLFGMIYYTIYIAYTKNRDLIEIEWTSNKKGILASGFLNVFGYSLILIAFTIERVSYIVGLRQISIVFVVLMGSYILKEKYQMIRFIGSIIIFTGVFLISFAK
jgi:uncharacterized membrane protein